MDLEIECFGRHLLNGDRLVRDFAQMLVHRCPKSIRCVVNVTWQRGYIIDQLSARMVEICSARSRMLRCSSAPSTSRLSTSEKMIMILHFFLFVMVSSYATFWYS